MSSVTISQVTLSGWQGQTTNVELRLYCDTTFTTSDSILIVSGAPGGSGFYTSYACTVDGTAKTIRIPSSGNITLNSTTDGTSTASARYGAYFFDSSSGALIGVMDNFSAFKLFPTPSPVTWSVILGYNSPVAAVPFDRSTYSASQIEARIAAVVAGAIPGAGILSLTSGGTGANATNSVGLIQKTNGGDSAVTFLPAIITGPTGTTKTYTLPNVSTSIISSATGISTAPNVNEIAQGNSSAGYTMTTAPTFTAATITGASTASTYSSSGNAGLTVGATGGVSGEIRIKSLDGTANYTGFKSGIVGSNIIYRLPLAAPASNDYMLTAKTNGDMNWVAQPGAGGGGYTTIKVSNTALTSRTTARFIDINTFNGLPSVSSTSSGPFRSFDANSETNVSLDVLPAAATTLVGTTRAINTNAPLTGGGTLAADLTLALTTNPAGQTPVGETRALTSSDGSITGVGNFQANRDLTVTADKTVQRLNVRANNGTNQDGQAETPAVLSRGRKRLHFKDGTNTTVTVTDDKTNDEVIVRYDAASMSLMHTLLSSSTHTDTTTAAAAQGSLITGQTGPVWARLILDASKRILTNDGTDVAWGTVDLSAANNVGTSVLPVANGGTNGITRTAGFDNLAPASPAQGDLLKFNGTNWAKFAKGTGLQILRVNAGATDLEYATISGSGTVTSVGFAAADANNFTVATPTVAAAVSVTSNPQTTNNKQASYLLPGNLGYTFTSVSTSVFATAAINTTYICRVLIPTKIAFNTLAFSLTTAVAASKATFGIYSPAGAALLVDSGQITTTATGLKTSASLSGTAVSGGVATLAPGHYIMAWAVSSLTTAFTVNVISSATGLLPLITAGTPGGSVNTDVNPSQVGFGASGNAPSTVLPASISAFTGAAALGITTPTTISIPMVKLYTP